MTAWARPAWAAPPRSRRSRQRRQRAAGRRGPSEVAPCVTGAPRAPLLYHVRPSSLLVTLLAFALVGDRERSLALDHGLAVVAGAALLARLHLLHGEGAGLPLLHLEDLDVTGGALEALLHVLLVAEGHLAGTVLGAFESHVGRRLDLCPAWRSCQEADPEDDRNSEPHQSGVAHRVSLLGCDGHDNLAALRRYPITSPSPHFVALAV